MTKIEENTLENMLEWIEKGDSIIEETRKENFAKKVMENYKGKEKENDSIFKR